MLISALCGLALVEYLNVSGKTLQQSIESEMSGNLKKLLVAVGRSDAAHSHCADSCLCNKRFNHSFCPSSVKCVKSVPTYLAERLYGSMKVNTLLLLSDV